MSAIGFSTRKIKTLARLVTAPALDPGRKIGLESVESWTGRFVETRTELDGDGVGFTKGDVLYGKLRPYLAKTWTADSSGSAVGDFWVIRPSPELHPDFLKYSLLRPETVGLVNSSTYGAKMPRVGWDFIRELDIPFPSMEVQVQVLSFIDKATSNIDLFIDDQSKLISLLIERRASSIGAAVSKRAEPKIRLKYASRITLGKMLQSEASESVTVRAPYLRAANVQPQGRLALEDAKEMWFSSSELAKLALDAGDAVVVEGGVGGYGRAAYIREHLDGWAFQNSIIRLRPNIRFLGAFLTYSLLHLRDSRYIEMIASVTAMPHFTVEKVGATPIANISLGEQTAIVEYLDRETAEIDAAIADAKEAIALSKERRAALISAAVTGKIDVRGL